MYGGIEVKKIYRYFTEPHPKIPFLEKKKYGIALLHIPPVFQSYIAGKKRQAVRTNNNMCISKGYSFFTFNPSFFIDQILDINMSLPSRQGRKIEKDYLSKEKLSDYFEKVEWLYGVKRSDGTLSAYAHVVDCGGFFNISRLFGHAEDLKNGVMYFLITEIIRTLSQETKERDSIWLMYDTFWGASKGLYYFKERLGFKPYIVDWFWK